MAKLIGGVLSKGSGRLGGHVLAISNGQQIIREYNPNVANPRTSLQRMQRAKMVLAGKMSAITPEDAIIGMAPNKRDRRSEYVRRVIKIAQVTETGGEYVAALPWANLEFSVGLVKSDVTALITSWTPSGLMTNVTFGDDVDAAMVVAVRYSNLTQQYIEVKTDIVTDSSVASLIEFGGVMAGDKAVVYVVPMVKKTTAGSANSHGVYDVNDEYAASAKWGAADAYEHLHSIYIGEKDFE